MRFMFMRMAVLAALAGLSQVAMPGAAPPAPGNMLEMHRPRPSAAAESSVVARDTLTRDGARRVMTAAIARAREGAGTGVIAIADDGGNLMCLERLDGTFAAGANISIGKARTAALFKKPTRAFEEIIRNGRTPMVALNDFTPLQGGVPILHKGQVVGAIGVSGAASAQEDENIAMAGAGALDAGASAMAPAPVTYVDHTCVASAFARGDILIDGAGGRNYMIHASRRDAPGQAEIHARDTDLIYVQDGAATLVTGGAVIEAKATAPDELRGVGIRDGQARRISKGDVIVVPSGTPHWFKEVDGPLTYYVVKVRA